MIDFVDASFGSIRSIVNFNTSSTRLRKSLLKTIGLKKDDKAMMGFQFRLTQIDLNLKDDIIIKGSSRCYMCFIIE